MATSISQTPKSDLSDPHGFREEIQDLLRGTAGGLIFGTPLLFTMEMWAQGVTYSSNHILILLGVVLGVNFLFSLFSGLRRNNHRHSFRCACDDTITSVGLSVLIATFILFLIGRLEPGAGIPNLLGMIITQALVVSIGVTFANSRFGGQSEQKSEKENHEGPENRDLSPAKEPESREALAKRQFHADLMEAAGTLAGAVVFCINVAPTEEILKIAISLEIWQQLLLLGAEFAICYLILIASSLSELEVHVKESFLQKPWVETLMATSLALVVAAGLLWLIGFSGVTGNTQIFISSMIVLGLPAVIGGAAGRLAV